MATLNLLNNTAYNKDILAQKDMKCFQIIKGLKTQENKYSDARQSWIKLSRKFVKTTGAPKKIIYNNF